MAYINGNEILFSAKIGAGEGENGATFTPDVSAEGVISWTNDKGLENPDPVNIKGPQGEKGENYILTEADKADIADRAVSIIKNGGVVGFVDENNNIILSGTLAEDTYSIKYELEDGSTVDIGELSLVTAPTYTNLFVASEAIINKRVSNSYELKDINGHFVTTFIDISNKVPFTDTTKIYVKGANFDAVSSGTNQTKIFTYKSIPSTPYSGGYSVVQGANITQTNEGDGVISVSNIAASFPSDVKYMVMTLKVSDNAITTADLENIVITIDEPIE